MIVEQLGRIPMSPNLAATLGRASDYAHRHAHPAVSLEHLLLALAEDPDAAQVLAACRIDIARLYAEASTYLQRLEKRPRGDLNGEPGVADDLRRIIKAAADAAQQGRRSHVNGAIVLAAILGDGQSAAAQMLRTQGVTFEEAIRALRFAAGPVMPQPPTADEVLANTRARVQSRSNQTLARTSGDTAFGNAGVRPRQAPPAEPPPPAPTPASPAAPEPAVVFHKDELAFKKPEPEPAKPASKEARPPTGASKKSSDALSETEKGTDTAPAQHTPDTALPAQAEEAPEQATSDNSVLPKTGTQVALPSAPGGWAPPANARERPPVSPGPARSAPQLPPPLPPRGAASKQAPANYWPPDYSVPPPATPPPGRPPVGAAPRSKAGGPPPQAHAPQPEALRAPGKAAPPPQRRGKPSAAKRSGAVPGQLVENIPRKMRVGVTVLVEARIAKADVQALAQGLQGGGAVVRHDVMVTRAMTVRLRAPEGGFWIETASPDTQWIESSYGLMTDDFASWRWSITPRVRGRRLLQLVISARTVGADGLTAETALPDQVIEVRVRTNYGQTFSRLGVWVVAAVCGGLLARFGEGIFESAYRLLSRLISAAS